MLQNHKLAKAISDVGWSEFTRQLEHKAVWYRRTVVKIDRWYPSRKTCSACRHVLEALTLDVREWMCPACGICHDRDLNAAKNVLSVGLTALNACGGTLDLYVRKYGRRAPVKQEDPNGDVGNPLRQAQGWMSIFKKGKGCLGGERAVFG